ncbi:MAG TPA: hypothetical protein VNC50_21520, partial [Planctomycetia bacterium]|nr:hypothetical protein [Planctomycetia bacterium]
MDRHVFAALLICAGAAWPGGAAASAQAPPATKEPAKPAAERPGITSVPGGRQVVGTLIGVRCHQLDIEAGGSTVVVSVVPGSAVTVRGATTAATLAVGARVSVTGILGDDLRSVKEGSLAWLVGNAPAPPPVEKKSDAKWLRFTGTVASTAPLSVIADRNVTLALDAKGARPLQVGGSRLLVELAGGAKANVAVELGKNLESAGSGAKVLAMVTNQGIAAQVTVTRMEPLGAAELKGVKGIAATRTPKGKNERPVLS